jgi:transcriptional regulator with XRE-family HTH domain
LRRQLERHGLTQNAAAVHAGVAQATVSQILSKGHVPKVEILFRLADYFGTPREEILRLAGHLGDAALDDGTGDSVVADGEAPLSPALLAQALLAEFRLVPDEWKPVAVEQMAQLRRLAALRPARLVGEEEATEESQEGGESPPLQSLRQRGVAEEEGAGDAEA